MSNKVDINKTIKRNTKIDNGANPGFATSNVSTPTKSYITHTKYRESKRDGK